MAVMDNWVKAGDAIDLVLRVKDENKSSQDLNVAITLDVTDPEGTVTTNVNSVARESLGTYVGWYQTSKADSLRGMYLGEFVFTLNSRARRVPVKFEVKD